MYSVSSGGKTTTPNNTQFETVLEKMILGFTKGTEWEGGGNKAEHRKAKENIKQKGRRLERCKARYSKLRKDSERRTEGNRPIKGSSGVEITTIQKTSRSLETSLAIGKMEKRGKQPTL